MEVWIGLLVDDFKISNPQPFGTFGGSSRYAKKIVPLIPNHRTYVEPFAGGAAMLYAKQPSEREVIADNDADTLYLHRSLKRMTPTMVEKLSKKFDWIKRPGMFERVRSMKPKNELEKFYRLIFIRRHAFNRIPTNLTANRRFGQYTNPAKFLKATERLKNVSIIGPQDYRKTIRQFDGASTFFFIDPPYPGEWFDRNNVVDLDELSNAIGRIKGKFISVINQTPENSSAFKKLGRTFRLKVQEVSGQHGSRRGVAGHPGGSKKGFRLFVANYPLRESEGLYVKQVA